MCSCACCSTTWSGICGGAGHRCCSRRRAGRRGAAAASKERTRQTPGEGLPVQSFTDLLGSLGALVAVELEYEQVPGYTVPSLSELTPPRAFKLLKAETQPAPALSAAPEARAGT